MTETLQLLEAAEAGDLKKVSDMLDHDPALVNASGEYGKTALHWAAEKNHADVAERLLEAGADIDRVTTWGSTPLEWAGYLGSRDVADLLIARGAKGMNLVVAAGLGMLSTVKGYCESNQSLDGLGIPRRANNLNDKRGWPPDSARLKGDVLGEAFQVAARNGHCKVAEYLLARGADVDAKGYFGGTGLHWAAINGHRAMVEFLLDHGADTDLLDHGFRAKPAGWAVEGGHDDIAALIRRRGGTGLEIERASE